MKNIMELTTETVNEDTRNIDQLPTLEVVRLINQEDKKVAQAIEKELPIIASVIDEVVTHFQDGGRIIYVGAGSSGRMGVLDAVELTPTYNVPPTRVFGLMAGGKEAMYKAIEGAEDSKRFAIDDLKNVALTKKDVVIAIAASGRTPYTIGALEYANEIEALSVSICCNGDSEMAKIAQYSIAPIVGPEVITGSTRMKAGTAQKMIVNMLSTGAMIKIGKVYQNQMVHVQPTNKKLMVRSTGIIMSLTDLDESKATDLLHEADNNVAVALVMYKGNTTNEKARLALEQAGQKVFYAIELVTIHAKA